MVMCVILKSGAQARSRMSSKLLRSYTSDILIISVAYQGRETGFCNYWFSTPYIIRDLALVMS